MAWNRNWTLPTNFNNNNAFDVNSVLTPNMFNVPYQNTLYLIDRVDNVETSITTKENALKETDKKTLYNLGAYDSVATANGITTITRQTGYLKIDGSTNFDTGWVSSGNGYYLYSKSLANADKSLVSNVKINCNVSNNQTTYFSATFSNYLVCVGTSYTGEGKIIIAYGGDTTATALKTHLDQNPLVIQYKLATSYQEQVIENQPLNTLDQAQSQIVREEVESGRNILELVDKPSTTTNGVTYSISNGKITLNGTTTNAYNEISIKDFNVNNTSNYCINLFNNFNTTGRIVIDDITSSTNIVNIDLDRGYNLTFTNFTLYSSHTYRLKFIINNASVVLSNATLSPMLVKGSTPPMAYSPYNANKHITNAQAKLLANEYLKSSNLLNIEDKGSTTTNGITYSISNGKITLNGTANANFNLVISEDLTTNLVVGNTYSYNGFVTNNNPFSTIRLTRNGETTYPTAFTYQSGDIVRLQVYIASGNSFTNATATPMLVEGTTIPTTFEPYHGEIVHKKELEEISARLDELGFREATISYSDTSGVSPQANSIIKQGQMCLLDFWIANTNGLNKSGTLTIPEGFRPQSDRLVRFYIGGRQIVGGQYILTGQYLTLTLTSSGIIEYDFTSSFVALFTIASSSGWKIND